MDYCVIRYFDGWICLSVWISIEKMGDDIVVFPVICSLFLMVAYFSLLCFPMKELALDGLSWHIEQRIIKAAGIL